LISRDLVGDFEEFLSGPQNAVGKVESAADPAALARGSGKS
jgi:hypothetical protein